VFQIWQQGAQKSPSLLDSITRFAFYLAQFSAPQQITWRTTFAMAALLLPQA